MTEPQDGFTAITNPLAVVQMLEALTEPGAASIQLDRPDERPQPVLVAELREGQGIDLDITAIRESVAVPLQRGTGLRLCGEVAGSQLRTPMMTVESLEEVEGRLLCRCPWPDVVEEFQRRDTYRATLRLGMEAGVLIRDLEEPATFQGDLRDLSMAGCLVDVAPSAGGVVAEGRPPLELELCFPNGNRFVILGQPKHVRQDRERDILSVGFAFQAPSPAQDKQLWFFVREIERESARNASSDETSLQPSPLFQVKGQGLQVGLRHSARYATPMARRLARVAGYLVSQSFDLRDGRAIDALELSRMSDRLLSLHEEDREGLLFALQCLGREPLIVQHGLAVAVRLVDIASSRRMPREVLKALAACGMIHDYGKLLLPRELLENTHRDEEEREYRAHVALLRPRLEACKWLSASVVEAVIEGARERLDGSGYPHGWKGDELHELTRLTAVVKAADTLARPHPEGPPMAIHTVHKWLASRPEEFDSRWVDRYFAHFGELPVGTLLQFPGGELGWLQSLGQDLRPERVQLTDSARSPGERLGEIVQGRMLAELGEPRALPTPCREGLLLH